jgi:ABC-type thiamine transport system ATPase subunit
MFELAPTKRSEQRWSLSLPLEDRPWQIGLIVGPSGCGKSTIARELFPQELVAGAGFDWPPDKALVDGFPKAMGIKEITQLLSSVGFSTPPAWLRPFRVLSNGEQFRATIARAMAEQPALFVVDEFTSVVDRQVAQIGSAAIAKAVRRRPGQQFVAVSCHHDIVDWLTPDWIFEPATGEFAWKEAAAAGGTFRRRRPPITLRIARCTPAAWRLFRQHHYLDHTLSKSARCFLGTIDGRPAVFTAVISFPHPSAPAWREHRTVCLPDFQGVGIGNAMSEFVASLFTATGKRYISTTSNPAMIQHRARSPKWNMHRKPSMVASPGNNGLQHVSKNSYGRITAGFEYRGRPCDPETVKALLG